MFQTQCGEAKVLVRLQKLEKDEHFADCEPVGDGIRELKINYAKGYRVYFKEIDGKVYWRRQINSAKRH